MTATGRLKARSFKTREGEQRTVTELDADTVAIIPKSSAGTSNWQQQSQQQAPSFGGQQQADPWATSSTQGNQQAGGYDEPPF